MAQINLTLSIGSIENVDNLTIQTGEKFTVETVGAPDEGLLLLASGDRVLEIVEATDGKSAQITAKDPGDAVLQFRLKPENPLDDSALWKSFRVKVFTREAVTATVDDLGDRPRT